jgi:hypothetical protein
MDAKIRFGPEKNVDFGIVGASFSSLSREEYFDLEDDSDPPDRSILSFSRRVRGLPSQPEFDQHLRHLELAYHDLGPAKDWEVVRRGWRRRKVAQINPNRKVEVISPVDRITLLWLGRGLVKLARKKGHLGMNDVLFIDHTRNHKGEALDLDGGFEKLMEEARRHDIRRQLIKNYHYSEEEADRFFADFDRPNPEI